MEFPCEPASSQSAAHSPEAAPASRPLAAGTERHVYTMAPLIRGTLVALYLALVLPLPWLAPADLRTALTLALPVGLILVLAATSEQVVLDGQGIAVGHPPWCRWLWRRGWQLPWSAVRGLTPVATSQGGRVFYIRTAGCATDAMASGGTATGGNATGGLATGDSRPTAGADGRSYLLPQRLEHFEDFLDRFAAASGLATDGIGRISPPWTYRLLALLSGVMLVGELAGLALAGLAAPG